MNTSVKYNLGGFSLYLLVPFGIYNPGKVETKASLPFSLRTALAAFVIGVKQNACQKKTRFVTRCETEAKKKLRFFIFDSVTLLTPNGNREPHI